MRPTQMLQPRQNSPSTRTGKNGVSVGSGADAGVGVGVGAGAGIVVGVGASEMSRVSRL